MIRKLRYWALVLGASRLTDETRKALASDAETALRAGVRLTLPEWRDLAPVEQSAWLAAAERVEAAHAAQLGLAASSPRAALAVGAEADGGAALRAHDSASRTSLLRAAAEDLKTRYGGAA